MNVRTATGEQLRQRANQWFDNEMQRIRKAHGPSWLEHASWVMDYLRAELAERLKKWRHE